MTATKLISQIESAIDMRDEGDQSYIGKVHSLMDELLRIKTLTRSEENHLRIVLDKFDNAQEMEVID